jgi:two-component system response regulator FlrC
MSEPAVLIVEDDVHLRDALYDTLSGEALEVITADNGLTALEIINRKEIGLVISDLQMSPMDGATLLRRLRDDYPGVPAVLMTAHGTIESAVDIMREGAADYLVKPFPADDLKAVVAKYMQPQTNCTRPVAADTRSRQLFAIAERVAATEATVTISGESGSGKEVLARHIHDFSARADGPFVAINCAAIPENMLEAVLFGYEKGAFTGAAQAFPGKFEQANGGTLLLDEISEMNVGLQAKLLRVIQEKEVERLGGRKTISLDVRVLATTNRDLRQIVADGEFREDLYYRLNVFPLIVPPLRERADDIVPLAELFLARTATGPVSLDDTAKQKLRLHTWPGNVRELDNLIQRTAILHSGVTIGADDLAFEEDLLPVNGEVQETGLHRDLADREFKLILEALVASNGRRTTTAQTLGISPRTLRYKLARMRDQGIEIPGDNHE